MKYVYIAFKCLWIVFVDEGGLNTIIIDQTIDERNDDLVLFWKDTITEKFIPLDPTKRWNRVLFTFVITLIIWMSWRGLNSKKSECFRKWPIHWKKNDIFDEEEERDRKARKSRRLKEKKKSRNNEKKTSWS